MEKPVFVRNAWYIAAESRELGTEPLGRLLLEEPVVLYRRADGTLSLGQIVGSIHKVGALAQGLPACNGWTFWHVVKDGKLICIDDMRAEIRATMRD